MERSASVLQGIPRRLPALMEAEKISEKAAGVGFEWPDIGGVVEKLQEEAAELASARASGDQEHIQDEIGDLLFTIVNLARFLKVDPEQALRRTNSRFRTRFQYVEEQIAAAGETLSGVPLERWKNSGRRRRKKKAETASHRTFASGPRLSPPAASREGCCRRKSS